MSTVFSLDLNDYFEGARREVRAFIAALPCEQLEIFGTEGYVASRTTDHLRLALPTLDPDPAYKGLEKDGTVAVYVHRVTNGSSLRYKPNPYEFGGWPRDVSYGDDRLEIRIGADSKPGPRERHQDILKQLVANVAVLNGEIARANATLSAIVKPELEKRRAHCLEIARRASEL